MADIFVRKISLDETKNNRHVVIVSFNPQASQKHFCNIIFIIQNKIC